MLGVEGKPVLIGGGTDGASVNISEQNGMRGIMQRALPWLFWAWCYAHRLELACQDSLSGKLFKDIQEMLLRLYYLYEKSAKKSRELIDIVDDLKETSTFLKEETYLFEHKVVDGSLTNTVVSSELLTDLVHISTIYQHLLKTSPPRVMIKHG